MYRAYFDNAVIARESAITAIPQGDNAAPMISERHRHRYEFNNEYRDALQNAGLVLSGLSPDGRLVETVELSDRPFYVGVQYHPEFKSRPNKPHPLFSAFIKAALQ